jgi:hypothetical protein
VNASDSQHRQSVAAPTRAAAWWRDPKPPSDTAGSLLFINQKKFPAGVTKKHKTATTSYNFPVQQHGFAWF